MTEESPDSRTGSRSLIEFDRVGKRYGGASALEGISFSIGRGDFVLLTGPSGAGKSTVLRLIGALDAPSSGTVTVAGVNVAGLRPSGRAALRRTLGIVPQDLLLLPDRTVSENVMLPALASGLSRGEARARAAAALERVGVGKPSSLPPALSGGEQQRVALARAIVNRPAALLADESTAHLDADAAAAIVLLLDEFSEAGITVVLASHGEAVSLPTRTRIIRLVDGRAGLDPERTGP